MRRRDAVTSVLAIIATLAATRYAHNLLKLVAQTQPIDFGSFYTATVALWRGRDPFQSAGLQVMADLPLGRTEVPPTFAPGGYLLFLPLITVPFTAARAVWLVTGQAALGYQPIYEDVAVGNLNLIVLLLLLLVTVRAARAPRTAGALA